MTPNQPLGPRTLIPYGLKCLGSEVQGLNVREPNFRGLKGQGLYALEPTC